MTTWGEEKMAKVNRYDYWTERPPMPSPNLLKWQKKIEDGWVPNARISSMGYDESAEFFGVYIWEYINVLLPLLYRNRIK